MVTVHYRRWCPPQSSVCIEFPPQLLHDVRSSVGQGDSAVPARWIPPFKRVITQSSGLLFGTRNRDEVRVLAAAADTQKSGNPNLKGLKPIGTFVCRARGEVFLTDDDLARFERHQGVVALVIAGGQAGFFVREPDGSVQSIRSHEEFRMVDAAPRPVPPEADVAREVPVPPPQAGKYRGAAWKPAAVCAGLLAVPAVALAYWGPILSRDPLGVALREEAGQLVIGWNPGALTRNGRLEIRDGSDRSVLMLPANTSSATYGPQSGTVEVRLSTDIRTGSARWEAPRFIQPQPRISPESGFLKNRIEELTREAEELHRSLSERQERTRELAGKMNALTATPTR